MSTSWRFRALNAPTVTSGDFDQGSNTLLLNFSEPVNAASIASSRLAIAGATSGTRTSSATGAISPTTSVTFNTTGSALVGVTGTVSAAGGIPELTSVASGLPVAAFGGLTVPLTS